MSSLNPRKDLTGRAYWRSLDELADNPEFRQYLESEFPSVAPLLEQSPTRRHFLKIMGASLAFGGLVGCRWPKETILPYGKRPNDRLPGVPEYYATTYAQDGVATGVLVTSFDGRPIKIEGNEQHPYSAGGTDAQMQASVLDLYDPDRSKTPHFRENGSFVNRSWSDFERQTRERFDGLRATGGAGLVVLAAPSDSPTRVDMKRRFQEAFPQCGWYEYSPVSRDNERVGTALATGRPLRVHLQLDPAQPSVIASFDHDFLQNAPANVLNTRAFAAGRTADNGTMHRLFVIESSLSLTGSNADYRYAERSMEIPRRLLQLAQMVGELGDRLPGDRDAVQALRGLPQPSEEAPEYIAALAMNLIQGGKRSVVLVGPRQPAEAHALALVINRALGATGNSVAYTVAPDAERPTHADAIVQFANALRADGDKTVVVLGGNPAYDAPADLELAQLLEQHYTIYLAQHPTETAQVATWHLNENHYLESWGDGRAYNGLVSIVQPLIAPLFDGRNEIELLALLSNDPLRSAYDLTRRTFAEQFAAGDALTATWRRALHDGLVPGTEWPTITPSLRAQVVSEIARELAEPAASDGFEVVFAQDNRLHDGRYANNGWLQEFPDPITKLVWDNAAMISIADANRLGLIRGNEITIKVNDRSATVPVCPVPGQAKGSLTLPLGYGRMHGGRVLRGAGFDAYALRTTAGWHSAAGSIADASGTYKLVTTQDHHAIQSDIGQKQTQQRLPELVREGSLLEYQKNRDFVDKRGHELPLVQPWDDFEFPDKPHWGMAIDLSKCTGCGTCVVACQAENNVPVVGKDEVGVGREMHWMRIDRYFRGDPGEPEAVSHQPVTCQHCENAPCEQVCPVAATVHDEQGLNVMVYNRCIGTRYCSNNCPYKVRRFNWFWNHYGPAHPRSGGIWKQTDVGKLEQMQHNPEVTVRSRGVMEKCTFCVQRIQNKVIEARNEKRPLRDGEVTSACAQACPADAIEFGNLNQTDSRIVRAFSHPRSYALLGYLNVRPRNMFLARLKNVEDPHYGQGSHGGHGPSEGKSAEEYGTNGHGTNGHG